MVAFPYLKAAGIDSEHRERVICPVEEFGALLLGIAFFHGKSLRADGRRDAFGAAEVIVFGVRFEFSAEN